MLTVIAIIAILTGILYPALRTIRDGPKKAQARVDIRKIEMAIQGFYNEYGKWPPAGGTTEEFYSMLNGNIKPWDGTALGTAYTNNNRRGTRFLEMDKKQVNSSNQFLDPWGQPYWVCIDNGGGGYGTPTVPNNWGDQYSWDTSSPALADDGIVRYRSSTSYTLNRSIAVYSWGPNMTEDDAKGPEYDDIASWY
jgi:type II secretory pathway pseudopilin PulG